jgi:hypothetical protein
MPNENNGDEFPLQQTLKTLKKDIRSLKVKITKVSERLEKLELRAFHDQISRLDEEITATYGELDTVKHVLFIYSLTLVRDTATTILHRAGHVSAISPDWQNRQDLCFNAIHGYLLQAEERIRSSCVTLDDMERVMDEYIENINRALRTYGFPLLTRKG